MSNFMTDLEKGKLTEAIEQYPLLAKSARQVLKVLTLLDMAVPAQGGVQASSLSKNVVYPALNKLNKVGLIKKIKQQSTSYYMFEIDKPKLYEVLDLYTRSQKVRAQL